MSMPDWRMHCDARIDPNIDAWNERLMRAPTAFASAAQREGAPAAPDDDEASEPASPLPGSPV